MTAKENRWKMIGLTTSVVALLSTLFSCIVILLPLTAPEQAIAFIYRISGATPEPIVIKEQEVITVVVEWTAPPATAIPSVTTSIPQPSQTPIPTIPSPAATSAVSPTFSTPDPPISTPAPLGSTDLPSGDWYVRAYLTDDANLMIVNDHIVGVSDFGTKETDWIRVNEFFDPGPNYVSFANLNGPGDAIWGFSLRHNEDIIWGHEGTSELGGVAYLQTIEILPDNEIQEVNLQIVDKENLAGEWFARASADDIGIMMVNGIPVSGGYGGENVGGWVDISELLYAGQDNVIIVAVWNADDSYAFDVALKKGDTIVWGSEDSGTEQTGEVYFRTLIVDGDGNILP